MKKTISAIFLWWVIWLSWCNKQDNVNNEEKNPIWLISTQTSNYKDKVLDVLWSCNISFPLEVNNNIVSNIDSKSFYISEEITRLKSFLNSLQNKTDFEASKIIFQKKDWEFLDKITEIRNELLKSWFSIENFSLKEKKEILSILWISKSDDVIEDISYLILKDWKIILLNKYWVLLDDKDKKVYIWNSLWFRWIKTILLQNIDDLEKINIDNIKSGIIEKCDDIKLQRNKLIDELISTWKIKEFNYSPENIFYYVFSSDEQSKVEINLNSILDDYLLTNKDLIDVNNILKYIENIFIIKFINQSDNKDIDINQIINSYNSYNSFIEKISSNVYSKNNNQIIKRAWYFDSNNINVWKWEYNYYSLNPINFSSKNIEIKDSFYIWFSNLDNSDLYNIYKYSLFDIINSSIDKNSREINLEMRNLYSKINYSNKYFSDNLKDENFRKIFYESSDLIDFKEKLSKNWFKQI